MTESAYYNEYWKNHKLNELSAYSRWKMACLGKLKLSGNTIVDIGCGSGILSAPFTSDFKVYGLDLSSEALEQAKSRGLEPVKLNTQDNTLLFEDESIDNVFCFDVLEHLFSPEETVKEVYRILKPGGTFHVVVPNILNIINRMHFLMGEFVDVMDVSHLNNELFSEHIRPFSKKKLTCILENQKFRIFDKQNYFPVTFEEESWKKLQVFGNLMNFFNIPNLFPTLFALGFFYSARKHK